MEVSISHNSDDGAYPPLLESGPSEDSDLAQRNFTDRERLSKSWRIPLFSKGKAAPTLLEKRSRVLTFDSETTTTTAPLDVTRETVYIVPVTNVPEPGPSQRTESTTLDARATQSSDTGQILIDELNEQDPSRDKHLYSWAMVYENQRGVSRRYSSRSLLPRDPPAFSVIAPASSAINGRPVRKSLQPDISLVDFPLPDENWRWASKEWMVDMRDEFVQHDGFEYNWFFRSKGWRSNAGRLNAGAWVRRRRWIRLMERPPLSALQSNEESIVHAAKEPKAQIPVDYNDVWHGDDEDWSRLRQVMHELGRDGRKLDAWKDWTRAATKSDSSKAVAESMSRLLRVHKDEILHSFIYPYSRIQLLTILMKGGLLSETEVLGISKSDPSFVDLSRLKEALRS
ncbi:hypothetical protein ACEPAH_620 [Sanghuangporus vaninii]